MYSNEGSLLRDSLGLPYFETLEELSELTRLSTRLLYCLSLRTNNYYKSRLIPKHNGGVRHIFMPSYTLHIAQKWILREILEKIAPSDRAMAYRKGKSYGNKQNAFYHGHTLYGLSIDLKDFFPSISANKVYTIFANVGYNNFAATILTNLCTLDGKLPQGSACSPAISNIVCKTLDKRLIGLCEKRGIRYSRYADDMYFSCDDKLLLKKIIPIIASIIESEGYIINEKKVHYHTPSNRKQITGITVVSLTDDGFELKAPRKMKQKIRAEIYTCLMSGNYENKNHILGEIAYVNYVEKENKRNYIERIKESIEKQAQKIREFPELVEAYNSNLFFKDLTPITSMDIDIKTEDEFALYECRFQDRKDFLSQKGLGDICKYQSWPDIILNQKQGVASTDDNIEYPF